MKNLLMSLCLALSLLLCVTGSVPAQNETTQEIADRYEQLLVRSPQTGPAFDRVVEWYSTQGGGLEVLQKKWQEAGGTPETKRPYLILQGLLAERQRNPKKAREFYQQALAEAGDPTQVARLLAILETTEGNFSAAAEAYQKALDIESLAPVDRMEIMRSLALLYQRSFEDEKALDVWRDALKRYPDDPYVLEEAGEAYLASGNYEEASKTFTKLRDMSTNDPFRKVAASLRLGRTEEAAGKVAEAVRTYELALEETSEGSWINREVRARIEELFRRKDDLPGLLAYYEKRVTAVPQDYQSIAAQGVVLDDLGRTAEAIERTRAATKLAPDNVELRLLLIRRLSNSGDISGALVEAEELAKPSNAPVDALLALGNLQWMFFQEKKDEKARAAALAAWGRIAPEDSSDTARIAQLAEIMASHDLTDQALAQWQRIIVLTPSASDARQKVAEILEKRGDRKGADAVLEGLVQEDRAVPENFLLLARIQDRLTWTDAARATTEKGLGLFPNDYELLNLAWRQAVDAKDAVAVERLFPLLWKNAPNEFFAEDASKRYVSFLEESEKGKETSRALVERLKGGDGAASAMDAVVLLRIALLQKDQELAETALAALKKQDNAVRAARAASEVAQAFGTPEDQILALNNIAAADPRMAGDSLRAAARIQADSGKVDEALTTVSQLIEKTPADPTLYGLYADLAARAGKYDMAVARLNEAVRYVEDASTLRLQLASLMQMQERTAEAAKVLQEAFEKEDREGRRMEIFRRQIELAMQSGTLDDLIASLREKQAKEQNGARYGAYLAEVYILQGDLITAREELARSLGRNPDNPAAVARLLDLADRGSDQQEGLRLAARLLELEPSRENRVAYISRLFEANELALAQDAFLKVRPEVLKDPKGWNAVLTAMQKAGLTAESDAVIEEIALASNPGVEQKTELANLRLMQRNYDDATRNLWEVVEMGDLAGSLAAVTGEAPPNAYPGMPSFWSRFQPLNMIQSEVQNSLQQMFQSYRGRGFSSWMRYQSFGGASANKATPEQRAMVKAFLTLSQLAIAQKQQQEFFERAEALFEKKQVPRDLQFLALSSLNYTEGLKKIVRAQADDPQGDAEMDKLIMSLGILGTPDMKDVQEKLQARVEKNDPKYAFEQQVNKVSGEFAKAGLIGTSGTTKVPPELQAKFDALLEHPGLSTAPLGRILLANLAANSGQLQVAVRLLDESADEIEKLRKKGGPSSQMLESQWMMVQTAILSNTIKNDNEKAKEMLAKLIAEFPKQGGGIRFSQFGRVSFGMYGGRGNSLAQTTPEFTQGDSEFPISLYRILVPAAQVPQAEGMQAWFVKNASKDKLDVYGIGAFYGDWLAGKQGDAIKRIEAIHQKNPTPRSAALLLEAYEKQSATAKALEVIDLAELQDTETTEIRNLRRLRLLKAAARTDEARKLGEKMARGRVSSAVRDQLANELNLLGVPPTQYQNLTPMGMGSSRSSRDRNSQLREQINKLVADSRTDEAEQLALQILQRPLPARDDYNAANLRQTVIQALKSMKRVDALESALQDRLTKDPADLDAAVRLVELGSDDEASSAYTRLGDALKARPQGGPGLGYALQFLQRNEASQVKTAEVMGLIIQGDANNFYSSGLQLHELSNLASNPKAGLVLADAVAGMSDENLVKLFMPARLSNQMMESQFLSQMAEFSYKGGKPDQAVALLKRAVEGSNSMLDQSFPIVLRLAELQLAIGQKDEARETMKQLAEAKSGRSIYGGNNLASAITNLLMNQIPGNPSADQVLRMARLAEQTGTLDLILKGLESQTFGGRSGISTSLLVRTMMGRPEIGAEWRKVVASGDLTTGYFSLPMLTTVLKALSTQEDGSKLMLALLKRIPEQYYGNNGAEYALNSLAETLPLLKKNIDDPVVKRHIDLLVSKIMTDPNGSQYVWYSQSYGAGLNALIDIGRVEDARKLLDMTAAARGRQNYGRQPMIERLEARLAALSGKGGDLQVICAAAPLGADKLKVSWHTNIAMDDEPADGQSKVVWDEGGLTVAKDRRPASLEIHAGPNPASLEKVAQIPKPGLSGNSEIKVSHPYGLLQAVWTMPDGSKKWGPLSVYVSGQNLIKDHGIPESKGGIPVEGYLTNQVGPTGEKSAVIFESSSVQNQLLLPLATLELNGMPMKLPSETKEKKPQLLAMTGWVRASGQNGNAPRLMVKWVRENGTEGSDGAYHRQLSDGQWVQFFRLWSIDGSHQTATTIDKVREMSFFLEMYANGGYNNLYSFKGGWDELQLVSIPAEAKEDGADELLSKGREAARKKDHAAAVDAFTKAFKLSPNRTLQQVGITMLLSFQNVNRVGEFFTLMLPPALYMWNPLSNGMTVQSEDLISQLVQLAVAKDAPPSGQEWLRRMQQVPLNANLQFAVESAVLREEMLRDPAKASATQLLAALGFQSDKLDQERVQQLWAWRRSAQSASLLLEMADKENKNAEMRALLKPMTVPVSLMAAQQMLLAWLAAPDDTKEALDFWRQSLALRESQNSATFYDDADRALLLRIAKGYDSPRDLVAVAKGWIAKRNSDGLSQQRNLVEILYAAALQDSPHKDEYAKLWADAETAALKSEGYNPSRDRVRELAKRLMEAKDWERLDTFLALSMTNPSLKSSDIQREFTQLRDLVAFSRGKHDLAWPVAWCVPGTNSRKVLVRWQWNTRDVITDQGKYDTAVGLSDKPILPQISGQQKVEIWYGEMPAEMKVLGEVAGESSTGSLTLELPAANGFLRAVAVFGDKRVPGPMVPVLSGRRVYPAEGANLQSLLTSGSRALPPQALSNAGEAPDGSPALRVGSVGEQEHLSYEGPEFTVQPGKFYVGRSWFRRAGGGSGTVSAEFNGTNAAGANSSLNMVLSERNEATGLWVLYTRAIPSFPQHTFWIPFKQVKFLSPRLWDMDPGTEVAGLEVLEIEGWKYGEWIGELAMIRQDAPEKVDSAVLDRALALAAIEPLTALDYQGDWLGAQALKAGRGLEVVKLYRTAMSAEPNPLFARPKLWRIFGNLLALTNNADAPEDVRREIALLLHENRDRSSIGNWLAIENRYLSLIGKDRKDEAKVAIRAEFDKKLSEPNKGADFLRAAVTARAYKDLLPVSEFITLVKLFEDESLLRLMKEKVEGTRDSGLEAYDKIFAALAIEALLPDAKIDSSWKDKVSKGYYLSEKSSAPASVMFWPSLLGDALATKKEHAELLLHLRQRGFDRMLLARPDQTSYSEELIRAGGLLITTALDQGNQQVVDDTIKSLQTALQARTGKLNDASLRLLLSPVDKLASAGKTEQSGQLVSLVEQDVRDTPALTQPYAKYLKPVETQATP